MSNHPDSVRCCPCCGQPVNGIDYGAMVWKAIDEEVRMTKRFMGVKD